MAMDPSRSSLGGTAVLMGCACGASSGVAGLAALAGVGATSALIQPVFAAVGAVLVLYGLWHTRRQSAAIAAVALVIIAVAAVLTPPSAMTVRGDPMSPGHPGLPWNGVQMFGAVLYVLGGAVLAYAFWRAFPSPRPSASATAMGGMVLATGCTACCMVTGAVAGMAVTLGTTAVFVETMPIVFWTGLAVVAAGLYRLGGWRAAIWVVLGGLITPGGKIAYKLLPASLDLSGLWRIGGVDLVFIPKYFTYVAGPLVVLYGFAVAYRLARVRESAWVPVESATSSAVPATS